MIITQSTITTALVAWCPNCIVKINLEIRLESLVMIQFALSKCLDSLIGIIVHILPTQLACLSPTFDSFTVVSRLRLVTIATKFLELFLKCRITNTKKPTSNLILLSLILDNHDVYLVREYLGILHFDVWKDT